MQGKPATRWRAPAVIIMCGCLISVVTFGPRSTMGFFLQPMSQEHGWGRDVFALAIAIQNLVWGASQPLAGAVADRFGSARALIAGALLYAAGLVLMAWSSTPGMLHFSAGVLIGLGLSGASFNVVISAFGKILPEEWRALGMGAGTAAGSFGQFLFSPLAIILIGAYGWQATLIVFGLLVLIVAPLSFALAAPAEPAGASAVRVQPQSFRQALAEAFGHSSYVLLVLGFFTCGFHIAFITTHLPPYLLDNGLDARWGGWVVGLIGLFNIFGAVAAGWLTGRFSKKFMLSLIYASRADRIRLLLQAPLPPVSALMFGAAIGVTWLSTVPPTSALVMLMFGTRYMATLFGIVFLSHQVGAFIGVWLGGLLYERTGSYDAVWWLAIALAIFAALVHLPIRERPVARLAPAPARA